MFCKNCGKEIDENAVVCPYCGSATDKFNQSNEAAEGKKINGLAIAGFVVSIISLWLGLYFCIASVVGLVLSVVAMAMKKKYNSCNALAIAGLVIGIVSLVIWALVWMIVGVAILSL